MIRKIIHIDEEKCNGCGACAAACHEGAIDMVDGKARLMRDDYCDGLGDCLPTCPTGAITFVEREAAAYDEAAVKENAAKKGDAVPHNKQGEKLPCGCPGTNSHVIRREGAPYGDMPPHHEGMPHHGEHGGHGEMPPHGMHGHHGEHGDMPPHGEHGMPHHGEHDPHHEGMPPHGGMPHHGEHGGHGEMPPPPFIGTFAPTRLSQWPVQIKLVPVNAPYFDGADLLIAADCTAYAYGNFHSDFIKNRITLIGCPKLDEGDYTEKLTEIIKNNNIKSLTVVRMEVPCCGGIERAATEALKASGKFIPWQVVTISTDGKILD